MGLLRFLLAMSVVVYHVGPIFGMRLILGPAAVEVFFAISGFYMAMILTNKYHSSVTFYINRFLRLYPSYLLIVLGSWGWFGFAWLYLGHMPTNNWVSAYRSMAWWQSGCLFLANWTMIGVDIPSWFHYSPSTGFLFFYSLLDTGPHGEVWVGYFRTIGQAWSVGVEIWFYLVAPFIVKLRVSRIIILIGASALLDALMANAGLNSYFFFPAQLWFFLTGVLLYRLYQGMADRRTSFEVPYARPLVFGFVIAVFLGGSVVPQLAVGYAGLILVPAIPLLFSMTRNSAFDAWLGSLSYPIYLVHMLVAEVVENVLHARSGLIVGGLSIAAAVLLVVLVEAPIDRFRQRVVARTTNLMAPDPILAHS